MAASSNWGRRCGQSGTGPHLVTLIYPLQLVAKPARCMAPAVKGVLAQGDRGLCVSNGVLGVYYNMYIQSVREDHY